MLATYGSQFNFTITLRRSRSSMSGTQTIHLPRHRRHPPPTPCSISAGQRIRLSECNRTLASAKSWTWQHSMLALGKYCAGTTAQNELALVDCGSTNALSAAIDGSTIRMKDLCWDATWCGTTICPGNYVELYKCGSSTSHNENFTFDSTTGEIQSAIPSSSPLCVSVCSM